MIRNQKVVAVIPARGGSKGLPKKNVRKLGEKELIGWTIEAAIQCQYIDEVIVSTDCLEIAEIARKFGAKVPFLRPVELANDTARTNDVVEHVLTKIDNKYDFLVLLQPTSPFRNAVHISESLELFCSQNMRSVVSVCELSKSPYWSFWVDKQKNMTALLDGKFDDNRRQDLSKAYSLNGAIYIQTVERFFATKKFIHDDSLAYLMDKRSSIDIDDIVDFKLAEILVDI